MTSADSHTLLTHEYLYGNNGRTAAGRLPRGPEPQYPVHLASCPRPLRGLARPFGWRVSPGFSPAQFLVCGLWFVITLYATLYKSTGTFTDPTRAAWVGVSQLPFVFAFGTKNNVISGLLGLGYEKLNFMHRFVARLVVLAINVHVIGFRELGSVCDLISELTVSQCTNFSCKAHSKRQSLSQRTTGGSLPSYVLTDCSCFQAHGGGGKRTTYSLSRTSFASYCFCQQRTCTNQRLRRMS